MTVRSPAVERVTIVEVGPRDGLQNEHALISTDDLELLYVTDDLEEAVQNVVSSYGTRSAELPAAPKADAQ